LLWLCWFHFLTSSNKYFNIYLCIWYSRNFCLIVGLVLYIQHQFKYQNYQDSAMFWYNINHIRLHLYITHSPLFLIYWNKLHNFANHITSITSICSRTSAVSTSTCTSSSSSTSSAHINTSLCNISEISNEHFSSICSTSSISSSSCIWT